MERLREKYHLFLLKHDRHADVLRDKILEMVVKLPIWAGVQFFFWKAGGLFYGNVHYLTSVYDVFSRVFPAWSALIVQLGVYYIFMDPLIEFAVIVIEDEISKK